jgi:hypothetical protein
LEKEAAALGLTLNDEKSGIRTIRGYRRLISEAVERRQRAQQAAAGELIRFNPYTEEVETPTSQEVTILAAITVLEEWQSQVAAGKSYSGLEAVQERQNILNAIWSFFVIRESGGLPYCPTVLREEPSLTPYVCRYMASRADADGNAVLEAVDQCLHDEHLYMSNWQSMWLLESVGAGLGMSRTQLGWARDLIRRDPSAAIAARAALTLARFNEIEDTEIGRLYAVQREASRPDVIAALALRLYPSTSSSLLDALVADAPEHKWIAARWSAP